MTLKLHQCKPGDKVKISGFEPTDPGFKRQLMALGLTPGTTLDIIRVAPMGDPVQIQVRNACLALRKQEAQLIKLELINA